MSLKRIFKFSKPKNPGYGISKTFYLSVLAGHAQLPSPDEVANPQRARGAVEGFLAPLMEGSQKEDLQKPMSRGIYALASKDRKTVVKLMVVSKEEANFDPESVAQNSSGLSVSPEALSRIRATWTLLQMTFESHDAMVSPAMAFIYSTAKKMAELTEGVVADPISQLYMLPNELPEIDPNSALQAEDHVAVRRVESGGKRKALTLGMQKFVLPEFEMSDLAAGDDEAAAAFLLSLCQTQLAGTRIEVGDRVGTKQAPFDVAPGGLDGAFWQGISCLEVLPNRDKTASECLKDWVKEQVPG